MQQTIVVIGGAGYIGSHTAYLLAQKGFNIVVIDTFIHGQTFNPSWATIVQHDFADRKILETIFTRYNVAAVMHFAALIDVGASVKEPDAYYQNNVTKTITLLDSMRHYGINKFIFSSSCAVYGNPETDVLDEYHPLRPISPYGKTKLMIEMVLEDYRHAYGIEYVSLRYFNACGAEPEHCLGEQHKPETHIIPLLLRAARNKTPFTIFGTDYNTPDGTCIRDYVHVSDIAQAHVLALEHLAKNRPSDVFNLGTGSGYSVKDIIHAVEKVCDTKIKLIHGKKRIGDPARLLADPSKAQNILSWTPKTSQLDVIIKSAFVFDTMNHEIESKHSALHTSM